MPSKGYLAFDLGAESGRAMVATLHNDKLSLEEVHRFANIPQRLPSGLHWNLLELWAHLVEGLRKAAAHAREQNLQLVSLGVDTWGVDFGLVGDSGQLLGLPFAYRDERNPPAMQQAVDQLGEAAIYDATGLQFLPFNSLFQLIAQKQAEPATLTHARRMLFMPDLLHYFFSGQMVNEATIASTSQMIDPRTGDWAIDLLKQLDLPDHFLKPTVPAGTKIGPLRAAVARAAGIADSAPIDVIVPGSHDTASAVAAVPVADDSPAWAYLSSGTWSLMGAELEAPIVSEASRAASFTNERGVGGRIRFLKNIAGLWLVQEVRRDLARQGQSLGYPELTRLAAESEPMRTLLNPDHAPFATPGDMLAKIDAFASQTNQPRPQTPGQYVRACLESLAFAYSETLSQLESLLGREVEVLHLVGGGGQNQLLNQMTADATGKRVIVGPYEATAIGNALTQALGRKDVQSLAALRRIVRASFELISIEPRSIDAYDEQKDRYRRLTSA